jgi:hypothetical protein
MFSSSNSASENTNQLTVASKKRQKVISELVSIGLSPSEIFSQKRNLRKRKDIDYNLNRQESLSEIEENPKKRKYKKKSKSLKNPKDNIDDSFCDSDYIQSSSFECIKKKRKRKIKAAFRGGKNKRTYDTSKDFLERNFSLDYFLQLRKSQINDLLKWKENEKTNNGISNSNEYLTYIVESIVNIKDMKGYLNLIDNQLQAILVNPPWNNEGYCFEQFKKINLPLKAMESGIIFIWTKKDFLDNMITYIEGLENTIKYVENLVWIKLSKKQLDDNAYQGEKQYYNLDSIFYQGKSKFFSNSHMTLLFFRKEKKENDHLELKHQRTNDAVFDYMDENDNKNYTPNKFVYKMIETLLPKATFKGNKGEKMKLLEIFSNEKEGRKGWIHLKESE